MLQRPSCPPTVSVFVLFYCVSISLFLLSKGADVAAAVRPPHCVSICTFVLRLSVSVFALFYLPPHLPPRQRALIASSCSACSVSICTGVLANKSICASFCTSKQGGVCCMLYICISCCPCTCSGVCCMLTFASYTASYTYVYRAALAPPLAD